MDRSDRDTSATASELDVSVVIVVRNGAEHIRRQLDALARQEDAPQFEVVVVDNGSRDGTVGVVSEWLSSDTGAIVQGRLVDASAKPGIPYARNCGLRAAEGRVIAFCDADDVVAEHWVAAFARSAADGVAYGVTQRVRLDGSPGPYGSKTLYLTSYLPFVPTCNLAMSRELAFSIGGFDESLPRYGGEDVDICWRAQEAGAELICVEDARVTWRASGRGRLVMKNFRLAASGVALLVRHPDAPVDSVPNASLSGAVHDLLIMPWRMLRPGEMSRASAVRNAIRALGAFYGTWVYRILRKPPEYVRDSAAAA